MNPKPVIHMEEGSAGGAGCAHDVRRPLRAILHDEDCRLGYTRTHEGANAFRLECRECRPPANYPEFEPVVVGRSHVPDRLTERTYFYVYFIPDSWSPESTSR